MLVSIIMPACEAQATIGRAVQSLLSQTWTDWEAVIVADDHGDYAAFLADQGIRDARLRFVSTGKRRSGCHNARNVGLAAARGDLVGQLDADDLFHPERLALLAPAAMAAGAAADNLVVMDEDDGSVMYLAAGELSAPRELDIPELLGLTAPVVPLIRRDHALPRIPGIEYAEDVIGNLQLLDRIGRLTVLPAPYYHYRIRMGSIANDARAGEEFEQAYTDYIARLAEGDGLGLAPENRAVARRALVAKRELNRAFQAAFDADRSLNFQSFVTRERRAGRLG